MPHRKDHRFVRRFSLYSAAARRRAVGDAADAGCGFWRRPGALQDADRRGRRPARSRGAHAWAPCGIRKLDGVHSAAADGDGADEDGVILGNLRAGQLRRQRDGERAERSGRRQARRLDRFQRRRLWGGPGEQIANNLALAAGNNTVTFDVPSLGGFAAT